MSISINTRKSSSKSQTDVAGLGGVERVHVGALLAQPLRDGKADAQRARRHNRELALETPRTASRVGHRVQARVRHRAFLSETSVVE